MLRGLRVWVVWSGKPGVARLKWLHWTNWTLTKGWFIRKCDNWKFFINQRRATKSNVQTSCNQWETAKSVVELLDVGFALLNVGISWSLAFLLPKQRVCIFQTTKRKIVEDTMKYKTKTSALTQTTEEYASRSSIHGISYIFDRELKIVDRFLWLFVVLSFAGVAAALTWDFWTQWRNEQVIKPIVFYLC